MYVSESDYHYFAEIGSTRRYRAGEYVFTRGDIANTVYLIISGRVLVTTSLGDGRMLTFGVLKKGSIFGDGAFGDHYLREVDISAVTDVELIECETEKLLPLLSSNETLLLMICQMKSRIRWCGSHTTTESKKWSIIFWEMQVQPVPCRTRTTTLPTALG